MIVSCNFILDDPFVGGIDTATLPAGLRARIEAAVAANPKGEHEFFAVADFNALFHAWNTHCEPPVPYTVSGYIATLVD